MKIRAFTLLAILLVFLIVTPSLYAQLTGYKIGVDPGHGRNKSGAVWPMDLKEVDVNPPTVNILSPAGGEIITAGMPFTIRFAVADNDALSAFIISYSGDGGTSFPFDIAIAPPTATEVIWNVSDGLETTQGRILVIARDRSGNMASAVSGIFTVQKSPSTPNITACVVITFDPPPPDQIAPPQNVRETLTCPCPNTISASLANSRISPSDMPPLLGYNIYRIQAPPPGQPLPTCDQIVNPNNLVGSLPPDATSFTDMVSVPTCSINFIYVLTSFYSNGQMASGCPPFSTDLPVIKNPTFRQGTIFIDAPGSFIAASGAMLIVNDKESYPLEFDSSGMFFTVPKNTPSTPGGFKIKKLIKKGIPVRLVVKNPDGKISVGVIFTRK